MKNCFYVKMALFNFLFAALFVLPEDLLASSQTQQVEIADAGMGGAQPKQEGGGIRIQFGSPRSYPRSYPPNYVQPRHDHSRWNYPQFQTPQYQTPQYNPPVYVPQPDPGLANENADLKRQIEELKRQNAEKDMQYKNLDNEYNKIRENYNRAVRKNEQLQKKIIDPMYRIPIEG